MATTAKERPTRLIAKKGDFTFELWVEIDGRPLQIYGENEGEDGVQEAWIASEEGKAYSICARGVQDPSMSDADTRDFPDARAESFVDGAHLKLFSTLGEKMRRKGGAIWVFADHRISPTQVQKLIFAKPLLTEDETPEINLKKFATIEVCLRRCRISRQVIPQRIFNEGTKHVAPINEGAKKEALLSAITAYGEPEIRPMPATRPEVTEHPHDRNQGYLRLRLRYAPKDYLQAQNIVPLDINIKPGEPGLKKVHPIALEDDGPKATSATDAPRPGVDEENIEVKVEVTGDSQNSLTARRLAEARALVETLEEQHRAESARGQIRPRPDDDDEENPEVVRVKKEKLHGEMNQKLKMAKEEDDGFVDLTLEDDN